MKSSVLDPPSPHPTPPTHTHASFLLKSDFSFISHHPKGSSPTRHISRHARPTFSASDPCRSNGNTAKGVPCASTALESAPNSNRVWTTSALALLLTAMNSGVRPAWLVALASDSPHASVACALEIPPCNPCDHRCHSHQRRRTRRRQRRQCCRGSRTDSFGGARPPRGGNCRHWRCP